MAKTLLSSAFIQLFSDHLWFNRIVLLIATIVAAFILIFHVSILWYNYYLKKIEKQIANIQMNEMSASHSALSTDTDVSSNKLSIMNHILTISILLFTLIHNIWDLFGLFGTWYIWFGKLTDDGLFANIACMWWHCAKYSMYYMFVLRIKIAFDGSAYEYSNKILYGLTIFLTVCWIYSIFADLTEVYGEYIYVASENSYWCQYHLAVWGVLSAGIGDVITSIVCLVLFIKPLLKILKNTHENDTQLQNFVIKYSLLTFIAISSTSIWLLLAILFQLGSLSGIDMCINAICILFMDKSYKRYYAFLCKPCHQFIDKYKTKQSEQDAINL